MNVIALPGGHALRARTWALGGLAALLAVAVLGGLAVGAMPLSATQVLGALLRWLEGLPTQGQDAVVLSLRLPRVLLAALVGAALACSGATMQGLFRNPLVEPGLVGVSAGAALGAIAMIVLGGAMSAALPPVLGSFGIAAAAFAGSLLATLLVYLFGSRRPGVATLLLAGVAINAIAMAGVGVLTYLANEHQLRDLTFWSLGSLGGASWARLAAVAPLMLLPLWWLPTQARALNALLLGEREASLLGFEPRRLRRRLVALVALATGAAVAMCGVIGFVGLLVPHVLRLVWGPDHRLLLPGSALAGASLMIGADALARVAVAPAEMPVGIITALLGGPFFLWLLSRLRAGDMA